jgi:exopolyphosphatase/pppGpp-phosphohydrolase
MKPDERLAVIDLGSNSFRLVVFLAGDGWWKRTDEIYEPVRIGEGSALSRSRGRWRLSTCSRSSRRRAG